MGKDLDYSKIKAMAQSILDYIGDDNTVGQNPKLPAQDNAINDGGQDELYKMAPAADDFSAGSNDAEGESEPAEDSEDEDSKKRKKDASLAMMSSMLKSKFSA